MVAAGAARLRDRIRLIDPLREHFLVIGIRAR
jgi:hypothetical protein